MTAVSNPFPLFTDTLSQIAEGAKVFIGLPDQDPEANPKPVFWDAGLTVPAAQPLRTVAGYIVNAGTPATPYVNGSYSIRVRQADGTSVYYNNRVSETLNLNVYSTKAALLASDGARRTALLVPGPGEAEPAGTFNYINGQWVRQKADGITTARADISAAALPVSEVLSGLPRSPAEYTGPTDTARITAAVAAARSEGSHAAVELEQARTYALTAGVVLDTEYVSMRGDATLDARGLASGTTALRIESSASSPFGNSYGFKAELSGFRVAGAYTGQTFRAGIGIDFNSSTSQGSAQVHGYGVRIGGFETGIRFSNRGYNSCLTYCEVFNCDTAVTWPSGGADNAERNTFISPVIYNSRRALVIGESAGAYVLNGGSIDYTKQVAKVDGGGMVFLTDMHLESSLWGSDPAEEYVFSASGNGACIRVTGGRILNTSPQMPRMYLAYVGPIADMVIDGTFLHNLQLTRDTTPGAPLPTAFFNGPGRGRVINTHGYDGGVLPDRLSVNRTSLFDPQFEATGWPDLLWVSQDTAAITSRRTGTNITLGKSTAAPRVGSQSLVAAKVGGAGSLAAFGLIRLPVRALDKVMAGFQYRSDPSNSGADDLARRVTVNSYWAKFDRFDANGLPIWGQMLQSGAGENLLATSQYQMFVFNRGLGDRQAPEWATDFFIEIDLFNAASVGILFDAMWADTFS